MILNSSGIKKEAKSVLKGSWLKVALVVFCYFLVNKVSGIIKLLSIVLKEVKMFQFQTFLRILSLTILLELGVLREELF